MNTLILPKLPTIGPLTLKIQVVDTRTGTHLATSKAVDRTEDELYTLIKQIDFALENKHNLCLLGQYNELTIIPFKTLQFCTIHLVQD